VVRALEAALEADPANCPIRMHLAGLLLDGDEAPAALAHLEMVLRLEPANVEALGLAARAARLAGDEVRAAAWQQLCDALTGGRSATQQDQGSVSLPGGRETASGEPAGPGDEGGIDWDGELAELVREDRGGRVTLDDVAGLFEVKHRLEAAFLGPLRHPELRRMYGASLRGGLLLWGPPGCGKTFLARAVAGELGAHFVAVGLHDVLDMWLGNSEKRVHQLFELARRGKPTVLFFDEVDAIGHSRSDLSRSASRNVVAQLLNELDGVDTDNDGVFVIGATNQPWDVDPALRRPGRFDRTMLVLPPYGPAREAIVAYHLRDRPYSGDPLEHLVEATEGFSGADLRLVCEEALQRALSDAVRSGAPRPIGAADLMAAARGLRPSTGAWLETASNFATYANTTGEYDELVAYLRAQRKGRR
jgi:AAA+ superfamily predicted ATPase